MIKKNNNYFFFLIVLLITSCSFDKKTGIWSGAEVDQEKISELRKEQKRILNTITIFSSESFISKDIPPKKKYNSF